MPFPAPLPGIAVHGIRVEPGPGLELAGTAGTWTRGRLVLAAGREPALALSWERRAITPDHERTRRRLAASLGQGGRIDDIAFEARSDGGLLIARGAGGRRHAAWRHLAASGAVLVARQLRPGDRAEAVTLLDQASAVADHAPTAWSLYGLRLDLPAWWRLQAVEVAPGLARGVWMLRPPRHLRTQAVIVMRRFALADRLLAGGTLAQWLRSRLEREETVLAEDQLGDGVRLRTRRPGWSWWRRWRGQSRDRVLHAWFDADGRILVHEAAGAEPLPEPGA